MTLRTGLRIPIALVRTLYAVFLIGTGVMTMVGGVKGIGPTGGDPAMTFLQATIDTGYLFEWVGLFKVIAGGLLLIPRTQAVAVAMILPYSVNILLWVTFVARQWLLLGLADFGASLFLTWAYFDRYRPLLGGLAGGTRRRID